MKKTIMNLVLLFIAVFAFAQAPYWQWAIKAGGTSSDEGRAIIMDDAGNSYVTGKFGGSATFGSYSLASSGSFDIFVAKMDAGGNWLWAAKAGGTSWDEGTGIRIDDVGNIYVTGYFRDTATFGSYSLYSSGEEDIFVAKTDAGGNWLWAAKAGGSYIDYGCGIVIDAAENIYVTGFFVDTATFGSYSLTSSGDSDIFVAKMDGGGNWLWATHAGGTYTDSGNGITLDNAGSSYLTGCFFGTATFGSYSITSSGSKDIFVAKMDVDGSWQWATKAGGGWNDFGSGITIDNAGNSYVIGIFKDTATFGSYSVTSSGDNDIFVAKMDVDGSWLWATRAGGTDWDDGYGITIDDAGNSYVTGFFGGIANFGFCSITSNGFYDIFVAKLDAAGNWLWATKAGGTSNDYGYGITIDNTGNSYVTGYFREIAYFGSNSLFSSGGIDIFVAKLSNSLSAEKEIGLAVNNLTNYPNPFNPETTISFSIPEASKIELSIYNIKGQKVKIIVDDEFEKGTHNIIWNGEDSNDKQVGSGVYFYKLKVNGKDKSVRKCLLLK